MLPDRVNDHHIAVIDYPAVADFNGGFVMDTGELVGNDDVVIHGGVIASVSIDIVGHIRLNADQLDVRIGFLRPSDSGRKQAVEFAHRTGVE